MPNYNNTTGVLSGGEKRRGTNLVNNLFIEADENAVVEGKFKLLEINIDDIEPRPINNYIQSDIEELARSIRNTNNRLIYPIVLVRPEDLPEDSKVLKKYKKQGSKLNKKYIIVAGERRWRACMLNRQLDAEVIKKNGALRNNYYDTITANVLSKAEAKNEELYYKDSNNKVRRLTPIEGLLCIQDALSNLNDKDKDVNVAKRNLLIKMNNNSEEGIDSDPDVAAKKFNMMKYVMWYIKNEFGIKDWSESTIKQYLAVINNCHPDVIQAILKNEFSEGQSRRLTSIDKKYHPELLELYKTGDSKAYEEKLNSLSKKNDNKVVFTKRDVGRQLVALKKSLNKSINTVSEMVGSLNLDDADVNKIKNIVGAANELDKRINDSIEMFGKEFKKNNHR